jgi:hypothetical protein
MNSFLCLLSLMGYANFDDGSGKWSKCYERLEDMQSRAELWYT